MKKELLSVLRSHQEAKRVLTIETCVEILFPGLVHKTIDRVEVLSPIMQTPTIIIQGDICFRCTFCHCAVAC